MSTPKLAAATRAHAEKLPPHGQVKLMQLLAGEEAHVLPTLLLVLSVPGLLPSTGIPLGSIFSLGMFAVGLAWLLGRTDVKLPPKLQTYTLPAGLARKLLLTLGWVYAQAERWCKPRQKALVEGPFLRLIALAVLVNAFIIFLPIPFGNTVPAAANIVLALAVLLADGRAALAGLAISLAGSALALAFGFAALWAVQAVGGAVL